MYLFDNVIRPLNDWALYKNRYCEREVPRPGTQHDGFDESSILELFIRGPVVLPVRPGYWVVSKMAAIIVQATCVYSNSELKLMIWQMTDTKEKHVTYKLQSHTCDLSCVFVAVQLRTSADHNVCITDSLDLKRTLLPQGYLPNKLVLRPCKRTTASTLAKLW